MITDRSLQRSRATRNQDAATRSRQGQVIDLDPTDGLPVQKYALMKVTLNQDASADPTSTNTKSTNSAEWAAQFNTSQYPWAEPPVPSFQKELPTWNQEMIRRARAGNTNAKLSVWDRKNNCWMSAAEAEKKATPLKSLHLNNLDAAADANGKLANGDADSQKSADDSDAADSSNESNKSADEDEEDADEGAPFKTSSTKRRKLANRLNGPDETRLIEVKKWVQLPSTIADRTPDRSFLAARRPGMPPLYNPEYAHKVFGQYSSSSTIAGTAGYDLGEGGGLSSATAAIGGGADATAGANTPQRKNIPPRRKKKKLGGPGRKPKSWYLQQAAQVDGAADVKAPAPAPAPGAGQAVDGGSMEGVQASGEASAEATIKPEAEGEDNIENESGSEAEGSEEGEIDETGGAEKTEAPKEVTVTPVPKQDPVSTFMSGAEARDAGTTTARPAAAAEVHGISVPATTATGTQAAAAMPDFVITDTDTEMKDAELEHDRALNIQAAPEAEPESEPQGQEKTAAVTAPAPATANTASPAEVLPPTPKVTAPNIEQATAIPGLGALNPDSAHANSNSDAEEQQIIQENAEAITNTTTNTSTETTAAAPEQITITGISEAIHDAAVIPAEEHAEAQRVKEDNAREAAGKVEDVDAGAEGGDEVDLLGAMDEAIDRGMSEGR